MATSTLDIRAMLTALLDITKEQSKLLEAEDYEGFETLLQDRQLIIDDLLQVDIVDQADREMLKHIIEINDENVAKYKEEFEQVKAEICKLNKAKRMAQQYEDPYDRLNTGFYFNK